MAIIMGTIETIQGTFFAKDTFGNTSKLSLGNEIEEGTIIFGDKGNNDKDSISISMKDGSAGITLTGASKWY